MFFLSKTIYVNVDSPNIGFPYFKFLGEAQRKNHPVYPANIKRILYFKGVLIIGTKLRPCVCTKENLARFFPTSLTNMLIFNSLWLESLDRGGCTSPMCWSTGWSTMSTQGTTLLLKTVDNDSCSQTFYQAILHSETSRDSGKV